MPSFPFSPAELDYLHTSLSSVPPIRPDLRSATDFRALGAETGVLPAVNGSSHVSFSDGGEVVVGVRVDVEKTVVRGGVGNGDDGDVEMEGTDSAGQSQLLRGRPEWVKLSLTLPGARDDDAGVVFLEEMLREALVAPSSSSSSTSSFSRGTFGSGSTASSLQDRLPINMRFHFTLAIDIVLISASSSSAAGQSSYPLPLISMAIYLALRDTRIPMLKSVAEEDPLFEDDWERSTWLYPRAFGIKGKEKNKKGSEQQQQQQTGAERPPITLLVMVVGENSNVIFDPSREELAVADAVFAVSVGVLSSASNTTGRNQEEENEKEDLTFKTLAIRTLDAAARDTMAGVAIDGEEKGGESEQEKEAQGVWKPRLGGVKKNVLGKVLRAILGDGPSSKTANIDDGEGVAADIVRGLDGFLKIEKDQESQRQREIESLHRAVA